MMLPNLFSGLSDIEYKDTVLAHVPSHHQALYSVLLPTPCCVPPPSPAQFSAGSQRPQHSFTCSTPSHPSDTTANFYSFGLGQVPR
ncbi:mCG147581 [Mus musculus]|nr:mCG147581 [Mus musculus]